MIENMKASSQTSAGGRRMRWGVVATTLLVALLAFYPMHADYFALSLGRDALLFAIFALSLDYFWGKTGNLSFGHATFFGAGAYAMAIVTVTLGMGPPWGSLAGLLAGVLLAGGISLIVGYFLIFGGVRGAYFTIVTLALTIIASHVAIGWSNVTGGDSGLVGIPPLEIPLPGGSYVFVAPTAQFYLALGLAVVLLAAVWMACKGHYGRVLTAIEDDEQKARSLGYHTSRHLLVVFTLSAMMAGLAGAIYVSATGFVAPDMIGLLLSTEVIVWVAVGGRGTLIGPMIGAFLVFRLQQEVSSVDPKLWPLVIGGFFLVMVFAFPNGILSLLGYARSGFDRLRGGRRRA